MIRKNKKYFLITMAIWCSHCWLLPAWAEEDQVVENTQNLIVETDEKIDRREEELVVGVPFIQNASFSGVIELNYDYIDPSDTEDESHEATSDLYVGSMDLELELIFNELAKAGVVFSAEDLGKDDNNDAVILDEAIITLETPDKPFYLTAGKTTLPFGVFEDRLIGGTLTEDLYDIEDVGVTLGYAQDFLGIDISATIYKGQNVIENLTDFGTHEFHTNRKLNDKVNSFITNFTCQPIEERLMFAVFYNDEPGDDSRNRSLGGAFSYQIWNLIFDAEFITAIERERGNDDIQNKENAWLMGMMIQPIEALELAARYEVFNDDRTGPQNDIVDYRYSVGFNYTFFQFATLSFEYRHAEFEKERDSFNAEDQNTFLIQLALTFE